MINISIVNYKSGNIGSIINMIKRIDKTFRVSTDNNDLKIADKIILPGVGHFENCMINLYKTNIIDELSDLVINKKKDILGICVGFQILFEGSEESKIVGLSYLKGKLQKFSENKNNYPPNIGWKATHFKNDLKFFYYLHSYFLRNNHKNQDSVSNFGIDFTSSIKNENILGCQFHPEKSLNYGKKYFENFLTF